MIAYFDAAVLRTLDVRTGPAQKRGRGVYGRKSIQRPGLGQYRSFVTSPEHFAVRLGLSFKAADVVGREERHHGRVGKREHAIQLRAPFGGHGTEGGYHAPTSRFSVVSLRWLGWWGLLWDDAGVSVIDGYIGGREGPIPPDAVAYIHDEAIKVAHELGGIYPSGVH